MYYRKIKDTNIVVFYAPKAGSSSINYIINCIEKLDIPIECAHEGNHTHNCNIDADDIIILISRNPYQRLGSIFFSNYLNGTDDYEIPIDDNNTFYDAINYYTDNIDKFELEHHRRLFTTNLEYGYGKYLSLGRKFDHVFDINDINSFINYLEEKLNITVEHNICANKSTNKYSFDIISIDKTFNIPRIEIEHKTPYNKLYNEDLKNKVYNLYKKDFEFFENNEIYYDIEI
jgi:hypothetical protein